MLFTSEIKVRVALEATLTKGAHFWWVLATFARLLRYDGIVEATFAKSLATTTFVLGAFQWGLETSSQCCLASTACAHNLIPFLDSSV
jgi:hypothetical protein